MPISSAIIEGGNRNEKKAKEAKNFSLLPFFPCFLFCFPIFGLFKLADALKRHKRIVAEDGLAVDVFFRYEAPTAAVTTVVPVIAHHKVMMRCNFYGSRGRIVRKVRFI